MIEHTVASQLYILVTNGLFLRCISRIHRKAAKALQFHHIVAITYSFSKRDCHGHIDNCSNTFYSYRTIGNCSQDLKWRKVATVQSVEWNNLYILAIGCGLRSELCTGARMTSMYDTTYSLQIYCVAVLPTCWEDDFLVYFYFYWTASITLTHSRIHRQIYSVLQCLLRTRRMRNESIDLCGGVRVSCTKHGRMCISNIPEFGHVGRTR